MSALVSITNIQDNELQFDIAVKGTAVSDMRVRFVIAYGAVSFSYVCKQGTEAAQWIVQIPKPDYIDGGSYDFRVEIITNGYYFEPYKGTVHVSSEPSVTSTSKSPPSKPVISNILNAAKATKKPTKKPARVVLEADKPKSTKTSKRVNPLTQKIDSLVKKAITTTSSTPQKEKGGNDVIVVPPINLSLPSNPTPKPVTTKVDDSDDNERTDEHTSRLDSVIADIKKPSAQNSKVREVLAALSNTDQ